MRKILNVHRNDDPELYQCIGCSPHNPIGLKLEFWEDGDELYAEWEPQPNFMGCVNVVHGGIQATLLGAGVCTSSAELLVLQRN